MLTGRYWPQTAHAPKAALDVWSRADCRRIDHADHFDFFAGGHKQPGDLECDQPSDAIAVQPIRAFGLGIQDQGQAVGCYFLDRQHEGGFAEVMRSNDEKRLVCSQEVCQLCRVNPPEIVTMEKEYRR